jgi:hypothetical protein
MEDLLHGDVRWLDWAVKPEPAPVVLTGDTTSEAQEEELDVLNDWVEAQGLPRGVLAFDFGASKRQCLILRGPMAFRQN